MPLIKRLPSAPVPRDPVPPSGEEASSDPIRGMRADDAGQRRAAARRLGLEPERYPETLAALADALRTETVAEVRDALLWALVRIGSEAAARELVLLLRDEDPGRRNGALDALRSLADRVRPLLPELLRDPDPDIRLLSTELTRSLPPSEASRLLAAMLEEETHPNAVAAAVDVLASIGTAEALPVLRALAERFRHEPFLPFAIEIAVARIEGAGS